MIGLFRSAAAVTLWSTDTTWYLAENEEAGTQLEVRVINCLSIGGLDVLFCCCVSLLELIASELEVVTKSFVYLLCSSVAHVVHMTPECFLAQARLRWFRLRSSGRWLCFLAWVHLLCCCESWGVSQNVRQWAAVHCTPDILVWK